MAGDGHTKLFQKAEEFQTVAFGSIPATHAVLLTSDAHSSSNRAEQIAAFRSHKNGEHTIP
jgi:hypothetical protein